MRALNKLRAAARAHPFSRPQVGLAPLPWLERLAENVQYRLPLFRQASWASRSFFTAFTIDSGRHARKR